MRPGDGPEAAVSRAGTAAAVILVTGWIAAVAISWPGHLSYDSIVQLHDGRTGFYHSWHPPIMAWLLGLGDAVVRGTGLFIAFDATLAFGALVSLLWIGPRVSWAAAAAAAVIILLPQFLLYQGIVWKDVLFADASVAGFAFLAHAEKRWLHARPRFASIGGAFVLFVVATLTRQNGLIVLVAGAAALFVIASRGESAKRAMLHAGGALAGALVLAAAIAFALAARSDGAEGPRAQLDLLRLYDLVGAVVAEPWLPLDRLKADDPELERSIRTDGVRLYSPQRNDTLVGSQALQDALSGAPSGLLAAQWSDLVFHHPRLYLSTRADVFWWVFATPDLGACRPVYVGVDGPAGEMADLGLAPRMLPRDRALARYAQGFMGTPVFSHVAYGILALVALLVLLHRRSAGDIAIAFLLIGALAFAASFFAIAIACDYRYLYFLDLASLTAMFYLALDPAYLFQVLAMWSGSSWVLRSEARKS